MNSLAGLMQNANFGQPNGNFGQPDVKRQFGAFEQRQMNQPVKQMPQLHSFPQGFQNMPQIFQGDFQNAQQFQPQGMPWMQQFQQRPWMRQGMIDGRGTPDNPLGWWRG